jgi:hypothetical protein
MVIPCLLEEDGKFCRFTEAGKIEYGNFRDQN